MPKLPEYTAQIAPPGPSSSPVQVPSVGDAISNLGGSVVQVADMVAAMNAKVQSAEADRQYWNARNNYDGEIQGFIMGLDERDDFDAFQKDYEIYEDKLNKRFAKEIRQPMALDKFTEFRGQAKNQYALSLYQLTRKRQVQAATDDFNANWEILTKQKNMEGLQELIADGVEDDILTQAQGEQRLLEAAEQINYAITYETASEMGEAGVAWLLSDSEEHLVPLEQRKEMARQLQAIIRAEKAYQQAQGEKAREAANRQVQDDFLQKLVTGNLTVPEVLKSDLPAIGYGGKEWWINEITGYAIKDQEDPLTKSERDDILAAPIEKAYNRLLRREISRNEYAALIDEQDKQGLDPDIVFKWRTRGTNIKPSNAEAEANEIIEDYFDDKMKVETDPEKLRALSRLKVGMIDELQEKRDAGEFEDSPEGIVQWAQNQITPFKSMDADTLFDQGMRFFFGGTPFILSKEEKAQWAKGQMPEPKRREGYTESYNTPKEFSLESWKGLGNLQQYEKWSGEKVDLETEVYFDGTTGQPIFWNRKRQKWLSYFDGVWKIWDEEKGVWK